MIWYVFLNVYLAGLCFAVGLICGVDGDWPKTPKANAQLIGSVLAWPAVLIYLAVKA